MISMTNEWATVNGPFPPLPDDIVFIRELEDDRPVIDLATRRLWVETIYDRVLVADPKQLPACRVQVLPLPDRIYILFGPPIPMSPRIERTADLNADLDLVASVIGNWPNVIDVTVCSVGPLTDTIVAGLAQREIGTVSGPLEDYVARLYKSDPNERDPDEDEDDLGWILYLDRDGSRSLEIGFGSDVDSLASLVGWLDDDRDIVEVNASRADREVIAAQLDAAGVRWRPNLARDHYWFVGKVASSAGMAMHLTISGQGWIDLRWAVPWSWTGRRELELAVASNGDGWAQLAKATRVAVVERQPVCFVLTREDVSMRVIFVPEDPECMRAEFWYDKHGEWWAPNNEPRTKKSYGQWTGPARALAKVVAEASQSLIDAATLDGVADLWGMPIPSDDLDALSAWLRETA